MSWVKNLLGRRGPEELHVPSGVPARLTYSCTAEELQVYLQRLRAGYKDGTPIATATITEFIDVYVYPSVLDALLSSLESPSTCDMAIFHLGGMMIAYASDAIVPEGVHQRYIDNLQSKPIPLFTKMLEGIGHVITGTSKEQMPRQQKTLHEAGLLSAMWSVVDEEDPGSGKEDVGYQILRVFDALVLDNSDLKERVCRAGMYPKLRETLRLLPPPPSKTMFETLFSLLLDHSDIEEATLASQSHDIIGVFFDLLWCAEADVQRTMIRRFVDIVGATQINRAFCDGAVIREIVIHVSSVEEADIVDSLMELMVVLGSHTITVVELKGILLLCKGTLLARSRLLPAALSALNEMASHQHDTCSSSHLRSYFAFDGLRGHLCIGELAWPQQGYSFHAWVCLERQGGTPRVLYSFVDADGYGAEAEFHNKRLVVRANHPKKQTNLASSFVASYMFEEHVWYSVAVTHKHGGVFGQSSLSVFVDGDEIDRVPLRYPPFSKKVTHCAIGAVLRHRKDSATFFGQMGPIHLFNDALSAEQVQMIVVRSPSYFGIFRESGGSAKQSAGNSVGLSLPSGLRSPFGILKRPSTSTNDVDLNSSVGSLDEFTSDAGLGHKLFLAYSCQASDNEDCFNAAAKSAGAPVARLQGVHRCVLHGLRSALLCLGGLKVLLPIFTKIMLPADDGSNTFDVDQDLFVKLFDLLSSLCFGEVASEMLAETSPKVFAHLLREIPPEHFTPALVSSTASFARAAVVNGGEQGAEFFIRLILDFRVWTMADASVQLSAVLALRESVRDYPEHLRMLIGIDGVLQIMRLFYWYEEEDCSVPRREMTLEDITRIQYQLRATIVEDMFPYAPMSKQEAEHLSHTLQQCTDEQQRLGMLGMLLDALTGTDSTSHEWRSSFLPLLADIGGSEMCMVLMASKSEDVRIAALRLLGMLQQRPGVTPDELSYNFHCVKTMLQRSPSGVGTFSVLIDVLLVRTWDPSEIGALSRGTLSVFPFFFALLVEHSNYATRVRVLSEIKLHLVTMEERRVFLQCSGWGSLLVSLLERPHPLHGEDEDEEAAATTEEEEVEDRAVLSRMLVDMFALLVGPVFEEHALGWREIDEAVATARQLPPVEREDFMARLLALLLDLQRLRRDLDHPAPGGPVFRENAFRASLIVEDFLFTREGTQETSPEEREEQKSVAANLIALWMSLNVAHLEVQSLDQHVPDIDVDALRVLGCIIPLTLLKDGPLAVPRVEDAGSATIDVQAAVELSIRLTKRISEREDTPRDLLAHARSIAALWRDAEATSRSPLVAIQDKVEWQENARALAEVAQHGFLRQDRIAARQLREQATHSMMTTIRADAATFAQSSDSKMQEALARWTKTCAMFTPRDCTVLQLFAESTMASVRVWRSELRSVSNARDVWCYEDPGSERWMLDTTETASRRRVHLRRNHAFSPHTLASQRRETGQNDPDVGESLLPLTPTPAFDPSFIASPTDASDDRSETTEMIDDGDDGDDFDLSTSVEPTEERQETPIQSLPCELVLFMTKVIGKFDVTTTNLYFLVDREVEQPCCEADGDDTPLLEGLAENRSWHLSDLVEVLPRRYLLQQVAIEVFTVERTSFFFKFESAEARNDAFGALRTARPPNVRLTQLSHPRTPREAFRRSRPIMQQWQRREISNFDYLMTLNTLAQRTYNDLSQYPVFPWILKDYTSETIDLADASVYRDLSKPMGAQEPERLERFQMRYQELAGGPTPSFHYGSHYSTAGFVLFYLLRVEPFASMHIRLQSGRFDYSDRLFWSLPECYHTLMTNDSDVKESIPEFYYLPEMLRNDNNFDLGKLQKRENVVDDVVLPPWASSPEEFIATNRAALESEHVSAHLHEWINLVFGCKQKGTDAVQATNIFHYMTYEGAMDLSLVEDPAMKAAYESMIENFGQTPPQLLTSPHPPRNATTVVESIFDTPKELKAFYLQVSTKPIVFIATPLDSMDAVACIGVLDRMVTVDSHRVIGDHRWLPQNKARDGKGGPRFTFERDPSINSTRTAGVEFSLRDSRPQLFASTTDCKAIMSAGQWDSTVQITSTGRGRVARASGHLNTTTCLAIDDTGRRLVTGSEDTTVMVWDVVRSRKAGWQIQPQPVHVLYGHDDEVVCVAASTDLDTVVSGSRDGTCIVHSLRTGEYRRTIRHRSGCVFNQIALSPNAYIVIFSEVQLSLVVFTLNGVFVAETPVPSSLNHFLITSDSKYVACGTEDGHLVIRRLPNLSRVYKFPAGTPVRSLAMSAGGRHLLVGLHDGKLLVFSP